MDFPVIKTEEFSWDGFNITLHFTRDINEEQKEELEKIVDGWYAVGIWGGFKGHMHNIGPFWVEGKEAGFYIDMGSAESLALDVLFNALAGFAKESNLEIEKVVLGL